MDCCPETGDSGINDVQLNGSLKMSSTLAVTIPTSLSAACPLVITSKTELTTGAYSTQVQLFYELFQATQERQKPLFQRVWMSSNAMPVDPPSNLPNPL
jgi:hypothetical protein